MRIIISCDGSEMGEEDRETLSPDLRVRSGTTKRFGHNASQFWKILFLYVISFQVQFETAVKKGKLCFNARQGI